MAQIGEEISRASRLVEGSQKFEEMGRAAVRLLQEQNRLPAPDFEDALADAITDATKEAARAAMLWSPYHSAHEGYGILLEEVDELKAHVFTNQRRRNIKEMRAEAIQVAAVALRFVADLCNETAGRR